MACVKWNFLAYCSASHATSVVQTIKRSIKLIYTQSERGKRDRDKGKWVMLWNWILHLSLCGEVQNQNLHAEEAEMRYEGVVFLCGKRSRNSSLPLLQRKCIFLLFLTILSWANFTNICSETITLKTINNRPLSLYN